MKNGQQCTKCNESKASHSIHKWWETPKDQYLCCKCYVEQGSAPADWHLLCIETYSKLKAESTYGGR